MVSFICQSLGFARSVDVKLNLPRTLRYKMFLRNHPINSSFGTCIIQITWQRAHCTVLLDLVEMSWPHPQQRLNISETLKMVLCVTMVYNYYPFTTHIRPIRQAAINVHVNDFDYSSLFFVNTTCPYRKKLNICFS